MTVPGVSPIISIAVVAAIGNSAGFKQGRAFGAWLGLVPKLDCASALGLESMLLRDPLQNPFSTVSTQLRHWLPSPMGDRLQNRSDTPA
jgi:hypothetical protein